MDSFGCHPVRPSSLLSKKRRHVKQPGQHNSPNSNIPLSCLFCKLYLSGPDKGCYYHELFLRGKEFLAIRIKRTKVKGTYTRKPSSPQSEPKFYNLPSLPATTQKKALRAEGAGGKAPALPFISLRASPDSFSNGDSFPERIASRRASSSFASSQPKPADTTTPEEEALRMLTNRGTLAQIMAVDPSTSSSTVPNSIFPQQQQQQLSLVAHPPPTIPPDLLYRESVASSSSSSGRPERLQQQQAEQPTSRDCAAALPPIVLAQPTNNNTFFSVTSSVDLSLALLSKLYGQGGR